ncbi:acetyl-CoA carboxylase carboxyl transferase subunit alpha [Clostridium saccharoperbutylacetonicum]|uniref:Acetyl-coenzyme A carboxylase carboxyl transferase subunit alpha n=1 Tax=Clostridium saccharoperbutylacetonicum N1-4(HMT) TaxID=931276 RepID=M1MFK1_9CLOT|nr:acetyl-CoA carboxylase carboxyltransferase subunit alpha [Clostridium saccharoperbutylacetonicum]AGF56694.1 acetyl-coenzyme A carboxylase carboxyl transferase subunit alpha [Clostridium saccharoperbutylacetonicum N1-4(HMT)]NRT62551.1 acetyl-CoA carboxylase carboxyl transferase subunit alpha [Clostridium saccharoperbutylacetonicum]NSB25899.1 acetyl-CoA carboxylase carboxyl transferase subunit alpha [Clostridium saccharoperbutylacetonicum]NSB45257.1 acetyl-CoA carboxylase carboxyl transferase 
MNKDLIKINVTPWESVEIARHKDRPTGKYYIETIFKDFIEFHGDRTYGDDKAIIGGIASLNDISVTVIAITKGSNTVENIERNFGMPNPEGYRKALRLMKQAEKFKRPVICFIDTPGAFPGIGAEERGQGQAIANNLFELSRLKTPIISILTGEGGSGGALALAVADKIFMLEHSIYSILSPEGFASILWKDSSRAKEAAAVMKITAKDLKDFNIIDDIIREPRGGAHKTPSKTAKNIKEVIENAFEELKNREINLLLEDRYKKFRRMGDFY